MESVNVLSENLRSIMGLKGFNGTTLSYASKVAPDRISDILLGKTPNPRIETVAKLARALDVKVDDLIAPRRQVSNG